MELKMFFKKFENGNPIGYLITEENLRYVLTHVDFDTNPPPKFFESLGYAVVNPTVKPKLTIYQTATEFETENLDGTWQQQWQVTEVSSEEKQKIFNNQLKLVTDEKNRLLSIYDEQLKDPAETSSELIIIQKWIDATKAMDISDPFNVMWPNEEMINKL
jgi:hypothetical protein